MGEIVKRNIALLGNGYGGIHWNNKLFGLPSSGANLGIIPTVWMPITFPHHHTVVCGKAYHNHCPISDLSLYFAWGMATKYDFGLTMGRLSSLNLYPFVSPAFYNCHLQEGTISSFASYRSQGDLLFRRNLTNLEVEEFLAMLEVL